MDKKDDEATMLDKSHSKNNNIQQEVSPRSLILEDLDNLRKEKHVQFQQDSINSQDITTTKQPYNTDNNNFEQYKKYLKEDDENTVSSDKTSVYNNNDT